MVTKATLALLVAAFPLALAAPLTGSNSELRLIKTSEDDVGQWVTEQEKFDRFTSKNIGFIDITDIKDDEVLSILSRAPSDTSLTTRAVTYPTRVEHVDEAQSLIAKVSTTGPQSWLTTFTQFTTRHYRSTTGTQASAWLFDQVSTIASARPEITVQRFTHTWNQPSIIARLPGESSNLIIVGAHMDSTAGSTTARSPGADDNGSGSVTILEALRVIAQSDFTPQNTIEFHWYSGEEGGLLGSQAIFSNYKSTGKTVLAMLNQDMTGFSPSNQLAVYTDNVDAALTQYVRVIATQYTGAAPLTTRCGYGCSDHASARSNGFPSAFVNEDTFERSNPSIHTAGDSLDKIQWPAVLRHAKFTVGFLVEASYL
ncbi:Zn-dependent exopeptidase [Trichoderma camerunense]